MKLSVQAPLLITHLPSSDTSPAIVSSVRVAIGSQCRPFGRSRAIERERRTSTEKLGNCPPHRADLGRPEAGKIWYPPLVENGLENGEGQDQPEQTLDDDVCLRRATRPIPVV